MDLFISDDKTSQNDESTIDELSGDKFSNHELSNLSGQFERESSNLFGESELNIVELMQDLLFNQDGENGEQGKSGSETVQITDTILQDTAAGDTSKTSDAA